MMSKTDVRIMKKTKERFNLLHMGENRKWI